MHVIEFGTKIELNSTANKRVKFVDYDGKVRLPWHSFVEVFESEGFQFLGPGDEKNEYEFLITCRHSNAIIRECEIFGINSDRRTLIVCEPECVDPLPYLSQTKKKYGNLYAGSESWATRLGGKGFRYFNDDLSLLDDNLRPDLLESELRTNKFVMIQAHKFSVIRGEQYSLRREVAREAWRSDVALDLYGRSWLMSVNELLLKVMKSVYWGIAYAIKAKTIKVLRIRGLKRAGLRSGVHFKGEPDDQIEVLKKYRYALVIENSLDFISEKLFNAMAAGCRVLYVGESLSMYGSIPSSVRIVKPDRRLIVEEMSRMLSSKINEEVKPLQIRAEAQSLFLESDSARVQRRLAEMILVQFKRDAKAF
jgi:hypothetical protein